MTGLTRNCAQCKNNPLQPHGVFASAITHGVWRAYPVLSFVLPQTH